MLFGRAEWIKHFGDVDIEPLLSSDIKDILNSFSPFWPDKKVGVTHVLFLIPEPIEGTPLNFEHS